MIDMIVRGSLGEFGGLLLDFYLDNALWINAILLFYAVLVVWAKQGYRKIAEAIKTTLIEGYGENLAKKSESWFKKTMQQLGLDWETLSSQTKIPIISPKGSLGFRVKSPQSLAKLFTPEKIKSLFEEQNQ